MTITNLDYLNDLSPTVTLVGAKSMKFSSKAKLSSKTVSWANSSAYAVGQDTFTSTFTQVSVSSTTTTTQVTAADSLFPLNWNLW